MALCTKRFTPQFVPIALIHTVKLTISCFRRKEQHMKRAISKTMQLLALLFFKRDKFHIGINETHCSTKANKGSFDTSFCCHQRWLLCVLIWVCVQACFWLINFLPSALASPAVYLALALTSYESHSSPEQSDNR